MSLAVTDGVVEPIEIPPGVRLLITDYDIIDGPEDAAAEAMLFDSDGAVLDRYFVDDNEERVPDE